MSTAISTAQPIAVISAFDFIRQSFAVEALEGVSPRDVRALLRILVVAILRARGNNVLSPQQTKGALGLGIILKEDSQAAIKVLDAINADTDFFYNLFNGLGQKVKVQQTIEDASLFIKDFRAAFRANGGRNDTDSFDAATVDVLTPIATLLSTPDSDSAFKNLSAQIGNLRSELLTSTVKAQMGQALGNTNDLHKQVLDLGKKLTGTPTDTLVKEQTDAMKGNAKKEALLKEFRALKNKFKVGVKTDVWRIVKESGKAILPVPTIMEALKKDGVPSGIHPGFAKTKLVFMNADMQFTDKQGNVLNFIGCLPTAKLEFNPKFDPSGKSKGNNWLIKVLTKQKDGTFNTGYYGTQKFVAMKKQANFGAIGAAVENIGKLKKQWRVNFKSASDENYDDYAPDNTYSYFAELLYWTGLRAGATVGAKSHGIDTYGAATALLSHCSVVGKTVHMAFPVKGAGEFKTVLDPDKPVADPLDKKALISLCAFLRRRIQKKGKKPQTLMAIEAPDGTLQRMNVQQFNTWLKAINKHIKSAKQFRTLRGTEVAKEVLDTATADFEKAKKKAGGKLTDKAVHDIFMAAMLKVGKELAHHSKGETTANTAIASYIDPSLMMGWYKKVGYAPNKKVEQAAKKTFGKGADGDES